MYTSYINSCSLSERIDMVSKKAQDRAMGMAETIKNGIDDSLSTPTRKETFDIPDDKDTIKAFNDKQKVEKEDELDEHEIIDAIVQGSGHFDVEILGHKVVFDLLNIKKQIQAMEMASTIHDDTAHALALKTAFFALSVDTIDDVPFYVKIANDGSDRTARYAKALGYHRVFIDKFFNEYAKHESEVDEKLENLKK